MSLIPITPALEIILKMLTVEGGRPIIIGGCVRDALWGIKPKDIDIEVYGITYDTVVKTLRPLVDHVDVVGAAFQVVTARIDGESYDISLPRRDSKSGSGHRDFDVTVDHTLSYEEASSRRDFTINSIGWDPFSDELLDPHNGGRDMGHHVLRHVSNAFSEDPLRVLRGMQFAARFDMRMHVSTRNICRELKDEFHHLSIERVWGEFEKLFAKGIAPSMGIRVLEETGWISHFPELEATYFVPQDPIWHPEGSVDEHQRQVVDHAARNTVEGEERLLAVLGGLCHDFGKVTHTTHDEDGRIRCKGHAEAGVAPAESFLRRIGAPNYIIEKILPIVREHMRATAVDPTPRVVRRLVRDLVPATISEWARVVHADRGGRGTASTEDSVAEWITVAEELKVDKGPAKPFLKGEVVMQTLMLKPGPAVGAIIKASVEAQDDGEITDAMSAQQWLWDNSQVLYDSYVVGARSNSTESVN